jgi:uncharacterized phage protein (TIGR02218 family)
MKTFHASLAAQYAAETATLAKALLVSRLDGNTYYYTDHDQDVLIAGHLYLASPGLQLTAIHSTADLQINTIDARIFCDNAKEAELEAGVWHTAACLVFEYNWSAPPDALDTRINRLMDGRLGPIRRENLTATLTANGLTRALNTRIGRTYSATCPWDSSLWNRDTQTFEPSVECQADLTGRIYTATITSLADENHSPRQQFVAAGLSALGDGYFDTGKIAGLTGGNTGLVRDVQRWQNTTFFLHEAFPFDVQVGDTFRCVQGDDRTGSTCKVTYNNLIHFGGQLFVPGSHIFFATPTRG